MKLRQGYLFPLLVAATLSLSACAGNDGQVPAPTSGQSNNTPSETTPETSTPPEKSAQQLDAEGILVPGNVVKLNLGDSVSYYSMPTLSKEDAQKVTIVSVEYTDKADLPAGAPIAKMTMDGMLTVELIWETIMGRTQSNQGYLIARLDSGETGIPWAFMEGRLRNGKVVLGEPRSGVFSIELNRGKTLLTLVDYQDNPVAELRVDTSK
ncbi:MAG: hypothetical protein WBA28_07615 [Microbacteriaceae bacterium]